ncbi:hypothetical protein CHLRE_04g221550v5 [Chlamydomonas reinhardtii]|uniref:Uncharacterized protein n=1 Tax=Chlamydomonas reinhardtii TaxID=3055 RepID=A0A2K3DUD0_CHLRE|nr:uncharacterized protein CHLRE_04g221550v5 [Chlamydomonas reinhardtii]PNW84115.1 hypothetical protein CHLRE_04g221550v5 [Chlamydomonas reinhardtii]
MQQRLLKPHTAGRPSGAVPIAHGLVSGPRVQPAAPSARPASGNVTSHPVGARGPACDQASSAGKRFDSLAAYGLARDVLTKQASNIEGNPIEFLDVTEKFWRALRNQKHEPEKKGPKVVTYADELLFPDSASSSSASTSSSPHPHDYDVVICGGTLGLFLATALQLQGWRVAIVEKRLVQGRNQEWNISWGELEVLVELGLLSEEELKGCVISEFNPIRVGFKGGEDIWTQDVLNLGVHPRTLLDSLKRRFHAAGGIIFENTAFKHADVHPDGIKLSLAPGGAAAPVAVGDTNRPNGLTTGGAAPAPSGPVAPRSMTTRLLLDCMGHYSDIVKQIRGRVKPDGMVLVVGGCAEGFPAEANISADLLYSLSHARDDVQLFWEAFPAEGGQARTTYMFAYSDAHPDRPSFEALLDTYFQMLPEYQGIPLDQLKFKRVLFGGFPCYSNGPLAPAFDRVMQIGDASAAQSPLSFGGFGSMMRHLPRLARGLDQALQEDRLARPDLNWLHPYQPSLSASWLFQRSMSLAVGQVAYPPDCPHAPAYYAAAKEAKAAAAAAAVDRAEGFDGLVSTAGERALSLQEAAMEAVEAVAARFAAGSADPADYFHVEQEVPGAGSDRRTPQLASGKAQPAPPKLKKKLFERDFRTAPEWQRLPYTHVNEILGTNFGVMGVLGDRVLKPFLQDTIQLVPLSLSMTGMMLSNPVTVSRVLMQVGPKTLVSWFAHYFALVAYSLGHVLLSPLRGVVPSYSFQRMLDALEYGSGSDYRYHAPAGPAAGAAVSAGRGAPVAAALSAAARSIDGGAATESMDGGDGGDAAGEAGAAGKSEGGSVKGRKAPKQQQPAAEPMPIPVPVAAATAAAAAMAAATMVVGLPGIGPVTLG